MHNETADLYRASDFRQILRMEYESRRSRRAAYSLRAFARDLQLNPSTFFSVIRGKSGISTDTALSIASLLKFSKKKTDFFIALVESQHGRSNLVKARARERLAQVCKARDIKSLRSETFDYLRHWFIPPALEVISLESGIDVLKLAKRLAISRDEAKVALSTLEHLGLVERDDGRYHRTIDHIQATSNSPSTIIRSFHKQLLKVAADKLESQPIENRKYLTSTFTFNKERTKEARDWLEKMHKEFIDEFSSEEAANSVFSASVQFFRMDEEENATT